MASRKWPWAAAMRIWCAHEGGGGHGV
jgi:hypothetical protein